MLNDSVLPQTADKVCRNSRSDKGLAPDCISLMTDNDSSTTHSAQDQHTHNQRFMTAYRQITLMF